MNTHQKHELFRRMARQQGSGFRSRVRPMTMVTVVQPVAGRKLAQPIGPSAGATLYTPPSGPRRYSVAEPEDSEPAPAPEEAEPSADQKAVEIALLRSARAAERESEDAGDPVIPLAREPKIMAQAAAEAVEDAAKATDPQDKKTFYRTAAEITYEMYKSVGPKEFSRFLMWMMRGIVLVVGIRALGTTPLESFKNVMVELKQIAGKAVEGGKIYLDILKTTEKIEKSKQTARWYQDFYGFTSWGISWISPATGAAMESARPFVDWGIQNVTNLLTL